MSIYASIPGLGDHGDDDQVGPPWIYRGSHIPPAEDDPRGGVIGLALIPSHITADGRDDQPEDEAPWPWLRLHLDTLGDDPAVLINPAQARHLAAQLTAWADRASPATTGPAMAELARARQELAKWLYKGVTGSRVHERVAQLIDDHQSAVKDAQAHQLAEQQRGWLRSQGYDTSCICESCSACLAREYIDLIDPEVQR